MNRARLLTALATASSAAACSLVAPAGADAAICFKALPAPGGTSWEIQQDGSQHKTASVANGTNFDQDHGAIIVNGDEYPMIPNAQDACSTTATMIQYPTRLLNGLTVSRTVTSIDGRIRRLDTIVNTTGGFTVVDVDYQLRVQGSQHSIDSETGGFEVTSPDHWSVHENAGGSFPFLQWGQGNDNAIDPSVISLGQNPGIWKAGGNGMPDATLAYDDIPMQPNQTVRLLHVSGTSTSADSSRALATDRLTPFSGLGQTAASQVVNWGNDPDADGVHKGTDACPGVKGNKPNGCFVADKPLKDPLPDGGGGFGPDSGPPALPPAEAPVGEQPAASPTPPSSSSSSRAAQDAVAPRISLRGLTGKAARSLVRRRGLAPRITCDEACSIRVEVKGRTRGRRKASTLVSRTLTARSTASRTVRLKPGSRRLRKLASPKLTVVITATDAAGNRRSLTRVVKLRG